MNEQNIEVFAALVQRSSRAVVFTGAGVSTECGIPDFRSPGGFWTEHKPIEYRDFIASAETRAEAWRRFFRIHDIMARAEPGKGHACIAEFVGRGHVAGVITQNIDGLHARSGIAPERIVELHGNGTYARCLGCGVRHELAWVRTWINSHGMPPDCLACGGILKAATVSFGQSMPEQAMSEARAFTAGADLFLAIGSSLQVFPAAGFPVVAKQNNIPLVIINRDPTGLDGIADLVIHDEIAKVLLAALAVLSV